MKEMVDKGGTTTADEGVCVMGVLAVLVVACVTGLVDQPHHTRHHIVCLARVHHTAQGVVCCATLLLLFDGNQWPPCWCAHPLLMCMPSHHTTCPIGVCVGCVVAWCVLWWWQQGGHGGVDGPVCGWMGMVATKKWGSRAHTTHQRRGVAR